MDISFAILASFALFGPFIWSVAWVIGDAESRGQTGCLIVALSIVGWPVGWLIWLVVRPRTRLAQRKIEDYQDAESALEAAVRLEILGDWDQAVSLYEGAAAKWSEHREYVDTCIKKTNEKQRLSQHLRAAR